MKGTLLWLSALLMLLVLSSCSDYLRIQKSTDPTLKYSYAKRYYNEGRYDRASDLLLEVLPHYENSQEGAQILYLTGTALMESNRKKSAADFFRRFYLKYPQDVRAEEALLKVGLCLAASSPDPRLDQSLTYEAIKELQRFLDTYPKSPHRADAEQTLFALQDKLAEKELIAADLYYNLGTYLGNNYLSAILTAKHALKVYPYTKHREALYFVILEATYEQAMQSVESRQQARLREVIDAFYAYEHEFPEGKHIEKARALCKKAQALIVS